MTTRPTGTVSFLFTDIEASTTLAQEHPAAMPGLLRRHHQILQQAIEDHHGHVFQIIGDAFCARPSLLPGRRSRLPWLLSGHW
jgi:class 3 adenylate cyclase